MSRATNQIVRHFCGVAALCAFTVTAVGCKSNQHPKDHPNLLLISVDARRADHPGLYGCNRDPSPNIDKWFPNGLVFDTAYSTEADTTPFLSGLLPQEHRVRLLYQKVPKKLKLVPDRPAEAGYQTAGVDDVTRERLTRPWAMYTNRFRVRTSVRCRRGFCTGFAARALSSRRRTHTRRIARWGSGAPPHRNTTGTGARPKTADESEGRSPLR